MDKEKISLRGADRTEAQKTASKKHSEKMKNKPPHNKTPVYINGVEYSSVTSAMKKLKVGYTKLRTMIDG